MNATTFAPGATGSGVFRGKGLSMMEKHRPRKTPDPLSTKPAIGLPHTHPPYRMEGPQ
jgi:hypothetical protein